jgi:CubicO group peptidase (beta-lactamase class C family)
VYYANPLAATGTDNPMLAGGLIMSMNEYARVLRLVFDQGAWQGNRLIAADIFDQQAIAPYPDAEIGTTPAQTAGLGLRYGLTAWLECSSPQTGCTTISSPGAFGFSPWLDREGGYFAILGMEIPNSDVLFIPALRQQLKPLIVDALAP